MKIECILKREGGTHVELGGIDYHFKPQADGAHVADIKDRAHIGKFLAISEGYLIYDPEEAAADPAPAAPEAPAAAAGIAAAPAEAPVDPAGTAQVAPAAAHDLGTLKEAYKAKFGSLPHHKWSAATIQAKLAEATE